MPSQSTPDNCTCLTCGKTFYVKPAHIRQGRGKYCSHSCAAKSQTGERASNYRGGRKKINGYYYVLCPDHPNARQGYVLEHRLVMEKELGRLLEPWEVVHHEDRNRLNNDPSNLRVLTSAEHARLHGRIIRWSLNYDACIDCGTTERKHNAHGLCLLCYKRRRAA